MILMIDNYDSFVYNLYQLIGAYNSDIKVVRNDKITINKIKKMKPELIVMSPGPGRPSDAGICEEAIKTFYQDIPILGICLGHQAIIESFGGKITYAKKLMHGKSSIIKVNQDSVLFKDLPEHIKVGRYHSLAGDQESLPDELKITAMSDDQEIMAVEHVKYPIYGLQFHPESILSDYGDEIIQNLLKEIRK